MAPLDPREAALLLGATSQASAMQQALRTSIAAQVFVGLMPLCAPVEGANPLEDPPDVDKVADLAVLGTDALLARLNRKPDDRRY